MEERMELTCPRPAANSAEGLLKFASLCKQNDVKHILDIGAGEEEYHANDMRKVGFKVSTVDFFEVSTYKGDYLNLPPFPDKFDAIWCAHTFEHQRNPGLFLDRINQDTHEGSIIGITVPPAKNNIVGGHVTLWNAGLLLYHLVLAGFDCKDASVKTYGYNISVIIKKQTFKVPELIYDKGDIEALSPYFPTLLNASQGFNGQLSELNWD